MIFKTLIVAIVILAKVTVSSAESCSKRNGTVQVNETKQQICRRSSSRWESDVYKRQPTKYAVQARAGHIVVSTSFYFDYKGDPRNRAVVLARLARVKPCIENFYCRFGFSLQLRFTVNSGLKEWLESDRSISLWDVYARSNYINWIMLQTNAGDLTEDVACSMAAHEVGHALGLLDAYSDEDCPDRPHLKADNNLMANVFKSPKELSLDRSQIRSILEPLCSEK